VAESITAMVTTFPDLESQGPFAPVFWTVGADARRPGGQVEADA
jgi:hypothetical protein